MVPSHKCHVYSQKKITIQSEWYNGFHGFKLPKPTIEKGIDVASFSISLKDLKQHMDMVWLGRPLYFLFSPLSSYTKKEKEKTILIKKKN